MSTCRAVVSQTLSHFRYCRAASLLIVSALLNGACATVTSGSNQIIQIRTDPSEATCTLEREGKIIGMVGPTPGAVNVEKRRAPVTVTCRRPGYRESSGTLASSFKGATFGNVILGGVIGFIVDAQSGATSEYETVISVQLYRDEFADEHERDAYFDRLRDELQKQPVRGVDSSCTSNTCQRDLRSAAAQRDNGLAELERQRATALVKRNPSL